MAKTIADPEELWNFANFLQVSSERLIGQARDLNGRFERLKDHWRDQKYARFEQIFTQMVSYLDSFHNISEAYVQHLRIRAEHLRRYLGRRY